MEKFDHIRPNYVREWFKVRRDKFKSYVDRQMDAIGKDTAFLSKYANAKYELESRPYSQKIMTQREQEEEEIKRASELHREKIKILIQFDNNYEETVPFEDFSSDEEEDPNADMKGKMLTMYNWKSTRRQNVT